MTILIKNIKELFYIPLGMSRSVARNNNRQRPHSVRDASLTGCKIDIIPIFTERCIPNGIYSLYNKRKYFAYFDDLMNLIKN